MAVDLKIPFLATAGLEIRKLLSDLNVTGDAKYGDIINTIITFLKPTTNITLERKKIFKIQRKDEDTKSYRIWLRKQEKLCDFENTQTDSITDQ